MSGLSPVDRIKAGYEARQRQRTLDVDIFPDGSLVARVGQLDAGGARDAMRTLMRLMTDEVGDLTDNDLAGVLAAATRGLYVREDDGALVPLASDDELPMRFDNQLATTLGFPEIVEPADVVKIAFTEGDPPAVNSLRLLSIATTIAGWIVAEDAVPGR